MDVRRLVGRYLEKHADPSKKTRPPVRATPYTHVTISHSMRRCYQGTFLPITRQLQVLGLAPFEGRQHCGIDVSTASVAIIRHPFKSLYPLMF